MRHYQVKIDNKWHLKFEDFCPAAENLLMDYRLDQRFAACALFTLQLVLHKGVSDNCRVFIPEFSVLESFAVSDMRPFLLEQVDKRQLRRRWRL